MGGVAIDGAGAAAAAAGDVIAGSVEVVRGIDVDSMD
jgi:hypothetical protein